MDRPVIPNFYRASRLSEDADLKSLKRWFKPIPARQFYTGTELGKAPRLRASVRRRVRPGWWMWFDSTTPTIFS